MSEDMAITGASPRSRSWLSVTGVFDVTMGVAPWGRCGKPCGRLVQRVWVIIKKKKMIEDNIFVRDLQLVPGGVVNRIRPGYRSKPRGSIAETKLNECLVLELYSTSAIGTDPNIICC